jgi:hypothetical protein
MGDEDPTPAEKIAYSVTMTGKPLLEYEPKPKADRYPELRFLARLIQRVAFAAGATALAMGFGDALSNSGDVIVTMGCGAGLMALAAPLNWGGKQRRE